MAADSVTTQAAGRRMDARRLFGHQNDLILLEALTWMPPGWTVLQDALLAANAGTSEYWIEHLLAHPDVGIAILDILPKEPTPDSAALRLRRHLETVGGALAGTAPPPVVHVRLHHLKIHQLEARLKEAFRNEPAAPAWSGEAWIAALPNLLKATPLEPAPGMQPAGVSQAPPAPPGLGLDYRAHRLVVFWGSVALLFGSSAGVLQYLGPPEERSVVSHANVGSVEAYVPRPMEARNAIALTPGAGTGWSAPPPGPHLALWPSEPMPTEPDAARAGAATRESVDRTAPGGPRADQHRSIPTQVAGRIEPHGFPGAEGYIDENAASVTRTGAVQEGPIADDAGARECALEQDGAETTASLDAANVSRSKAVASTGVDAPDFDTAADDEVPSMALVGDSALGAGRGQNENGPVRTEAEGAALPAPLRPQSGSAETVDAGEGASIAPVPTSMKWPSADISSERAGGDFHGNSQTALAQDESAGADAQGARDLADVQSTVPHHVDGPTEANARAMEPAPHSAPAAATAAPATSAVESSAVPIMHEPLTAPLLRPAETSAQNTAAAASAAHSAAMPQRPPSRASSTVVAALLARGDALVAIGDVAAARLVYQRAATQASARAATAIGRTYDPRFLQAIGAIGVIADPDAAAGWYRKAVALGDEDAPPLLSGLDAKASQ